MPNEVNYDAEGDSLGQIFSDLFVSVGSGSSSGLFKDFIEFLEGNVEGFGSGVEDDADLRMLLSTGSMTEIRNEIDDTELVVNQLNAKLKTIENEMAVIDGELKMSAKYLDKMKLEESKAELSAQKNVAVDYLKKANKRLLALQTRCQELMNRNRDSYAREDEPTTWDDIKREASSSGYSKTAASSPENKEAAKTEQESWMNEGFGSSSRGRGRGRRGRRGSSSYGDRDSSNTRQRDPPYRQEANEARTSRTTNDSSKGNSWKSQAFSSSRRKTDFSKETKSIPPHRRAYTSYSSQEEDRRRMREIKVEEDFEKLKREMGL